MEIYNVCVLQSKYNTYGEKLMVYGYSLMKRQRLERTNNVSSKKTTQLAFARVLHANYKQPMFDCIYKPIYIIITFSVGLKQSEMRV